jgi:hypothetical protein
VISGAELLTSWPRWALIPSHSDGTSDSGDGSKNEYQDPQGPLAGVTSGQHMGVREAANRRTVM